MGVLGKDLFDIYRPYTHTKVLFGRDYYWVEYCPTPQPYGSTLLQLLEYEADGYLQSIDSLKSALAKENHDEIRDCFVAVAFEFMKLPFYQLYVKDVGALEPEILREIVYPTRSSLVDRLAVDDGNILNKYFWAEEDIRLIKERYTWFLDELFRDTIPEKQKGQKKVSLAEQVYNHQLEPFVSGRSLGGDSEIDAPQVNIQYMIHESDEHSPELVEKMYFDRLSDFVYVEFMKGLQKGYVVKRCASCGKWFLQQPGATYVYCANIAPGETNRTCRDIGASASFNDKVRNNDIWKIHQRAYKKYYARVMKKNWTKAEFESWASSAEQLRDSALKKYSNSQDEAERKMIAAEFQKEVNAQ